MRRWSVTFEFRELAISLGTKRFTVASLIRLRCAGSDIRGLSTKVDPSHESNLSYRSFPDALLNLATQKLFAGALEAHRDSLTLGNRRDLAASPTTMTAAETLAAPNTPLLIVDDSLSGAAPREETLHPELSAFRVIASLCKRSNASQWAT